MSESPLSEAIAELEADLRALSCSDAGDILLAMGKVGCLEESLESPPADVAALIDAASEATRTGLAEDHSAEETIEAVLALLARAREAAAGGTDPSDTPVEPAPAEETEENTSAELDAPASEDEPSVVAAEGSPAVEDDPIEQHLERAAALVMTVGMDDLTDLGTIHTELEGVYAGTAGTWPATAGLAEALTDLAHALILDECTAPHLAVDAIAQGVDTLQQLYRDIRREDRETLDVAGLTAEARALCRGDGIDAAAADVETEAAAEAGVEAPEHEASPFDEAAHGQAAADPEAPAVAGEPEAAPIEEPVFDLTQMDTDIFADFSAEAEEHLEGAETNLLSLESAPTDPDLLDSVFRSFHTIKGAAGFLNLEPIVRTAHAGEDILDSARKGQMTLTSPILDVLLEAVDLLKQLMAVVEAGLQAGSVQPLPVVPMIRRLHAVLSGDPVAPPSAPAEGSEETVLPQPEGPAGGEEPASPGQPPAPGLAAPPPKPSKAAQQFVRVDTEKLDQLVNLVGELAIAQTQVSQNPATLRANDPKLNKDIVQMVKISHDLQEISMSMRMVPIKGTFERMARMVRDLSRKMDKQVKFEMMGEDTELDKNVVEEIVDPLTHMVRNALDHGIESPEDRAAAGKSEEGTVTLEAYHKGGNIVIELREDGRGLDRDRILAKAVERGIVSPDETIPDDEIFKLIFNAGFSTAAQVSDVSGRGVGMDVVRRNIEKLRGTVDLTTEKGKGTTFVIRLPLTLAIIDGMVIGVGEERYILPLTSIVRSLRPSDDQLFTVLEKGEMLKVQDEMFPLIRLHERFDVPARHRDPKTGLLVIVESEGKRCALLVDELVGMQQVVIKGLDKALRQDRSFAGCAILGDGQVGLILDVNSMVGEVSQRGAYKAAS